MPTFPKAPLAETVTRPWASFECGKSASRCTASLVRGGKCPEAAVLPDEYTSHVQQLLLFE